MNGNFNFTKEDSIKENTSKAIEIYEEKTLRKVHDITMVRHSEESFSFVLMVTRPITSDMMEKVALSACIIGKDCYVDYDDFDRLWTLNQVIEEYKHL